ncbi:ATP synthase protein I [Mesocricetibacter intestinalis]|uniref:ATP synthase protein I n=1 Tax=Mesocricetibacter intestinalis TaxID=1521930 RepID=A0A4R6VB92_9PAST|nr:ATP synthase subunit I [Mesocricetibacter intestinalis]TDQ57713.1 ATP synthase protein I [Mesocricetibacter intestinalis]
MSLVLANTKRLYIKAFLVELLLIFICAGIVYLLFAHKFSSFLLGSLIAFVPQIAFIGYALFIKSHVPVENKAKVLYQSEGLKLALTVSFFILVFVCLKPDFAGLFTGYFIFIILNNLLPLLFNLNSNRQ